jgi:hypothetical protein
LTDAGTSQSGRSNHLPLKKKKKKPNETKPNPPKLNQTIKKWYMILSENFFKKKKKFIPMHLIVDP